MKLKVLSTIVAAVMVLNLGTPLVWAEDSPSNVSQERERLRKAQQELEELRRRFEKEVETTAVIEKSSEMEPQKKMIEVSKSLETKQVKDENLSQEIEETEKAKQDLQNMRDSLRKKQETIDQRRKESLAEAEKSKVEWEELETQKKKLNQIEQADKLKKQKEDLAREIETFRAQNGQVLEVRESEIESYSGEVARIKESLERERKEMETLQSQLDEREKKSQAHQKEIEDQLAQVEKEREAFELEKKVRQQKLQELEGQYQQLESTEQALREGRESYHPTEISVSRAEQGSGASSDSGYGGAASSSAQYSPDFKYTVEYGDSLDIQVWKVGELSREAIVSPDGYIAFPLIGDIPVIGLNLKQVDDVLTRKISEFVKNPQVSISIRSFGGRRVIMLGEVKGPGVYRFTQETTLLEAIALAGGFQKYAKTREVALIRGDPRTEPKVKVIKVDTNRTLRHGMLSENILLKSNDIVYVSRGFLGNYQDFINDLAKPTMSTMLDFYVLREAIRVVQQRNRS